MGYYSSDSSSDDDEYPCHQCGCVFTSSWDLSSHERGQHAHRCNKCNRDFVNNHALDQHLSNSSAHHYCQWCKRGFPDSWDWHAHNRSEHSECVPCQLYFNNYLQLRLHCRDSPNHLYCYDCDRHFDAPDNLKHHLASGVHRDRDVECLHSSCNRCFISLAALVAHYDSEGAGCWQVTRDALYRAMRRFDHSFYVCRREGCDADYHCPNCNKRFSLLSGVCNHIAGGTCSDESRKEEMEDRIWQLLRSAVAWVCH